MQSSNNSNSPHSKELDLLQSQEWANIRRFLCSLRAEDLERGMQANPLTAEGQYTNLVAKGEAKRAAYLCSKQFAEHLCNYLDKTT